MKCFYCFQQFNDTNRKLLSVKTLNKLSVSNISEMSENSNDDDGVPNYIKEFINKIADREGFTNYVITHTAGSNTGDGFLGDLLRFKINGQQNNTLSTLSLICKLPSINPVQRVEMHTDITFSREILLYDYVLPYFVEFQKENGVSEADGFYSFPKCYGTILDAKPNGDHAIVMEDLLVNNYYLFDKLKKIDYERAKLVLVELGKLHAVSFAIRAKSPEKLHEIQSKAYNDHHKSMYRSPVAMEFLNTNIEKAVGSLEQHEIGLIKKVEAVKGNNCFDVIDQVFSNLTPEPFGVIVHGDMWNNNVMYQNADNAKPSKLMFIDWQMSQFGSPALDVAHYIFCSLDEDIRGQYYHEFVDCYYNSLSQTIKKFGCNDQELFTLTDLKNQFKKYGRTCLFAGPILCQIMTVNPTDLPDMNSVLQQWQEIAETGETQDRLDMFGPLSTSFKPRMSSLLRDCDREGLI